MLKKIGTWWRGDEKKEEAASAAPASLAATAKSPAPRSPTVSSPAAAPVPRISQSEEVYTPVNPLYRGTGDLYLREGQQFELKLKSATILVDNIANFQCMRTVSPVSFSSRTRFARHFGWFGCGYETTYWHLHDLSVLRCA